MPIAHTYIEPFPHREDRAQARPGLILRLRVRLNALTLDSALAGGAAPAASEALALRARQLAEPKSREETAASIEHLLELVDRGSPTRLAATRLPFSRSRVLAVRPQLVELIERLRAEDALPVKGLAMASLLLEDGRGPLFVHDTPDGLERTVKATLSEVGG